jgi:hypothetical protein
MLSAFNRNDIGSNPIGGTNERDKDLINFNVMCSVTVTHLTVYQESGFKSHTSRKRRYLLNGIGIQNFNLVNMSSNPIDDTNLLLRYFEKKYCKLNLCVTGNGHPCRFGTGKM